MMKTAFAHWDDRIAPVFDIARRLHVVEDDEGRIVAETGEALADGLPAQKAHRLLELGVGTLVCGAISRPFQEIVAAYGIQVIPFVAGALSDVVQAWLSGNLSSDTFVMPGCSGRGCRGMHGRHKEGHSMNGGKRDGTGPVGGQGKGRLGQGRGRMGGPFAAGGIGTCLCPKCGHREPHERGAPCVQKKCPECGTAMTRE